MVAAFVLYVWIGVGDDRRLASKDLVWSNLNSCVWYAQALHKQGQKISAYCLPIMVPEGTKIYD